MNLAPVVLFVYNRPDHTRRTLEALRKNHLSSDSILYIYADGPKEGITEEQLNLLNSTRGILREQQWCSTVKIIESPSNKGLAKSILEGVSEIVNKYGKIIVLEDDIRTDKRFLEYMNLALDFYESNNKIFHINGCNFHSNLQFLVKKVYFTNFMNCWGWATWKNRWKELNTSHLYYLNKLNKDTDLLSTFNYDNVLSFHEQLKANVDKRLNTWAILWYSTVFFNKGYCLTPKHSFVENIGLDGSGTNCDNEEKNFQFFSNHKQIVTNDLSNLNVSESFFSRWHLKLYFLYGSKVSFIQIFRKIISKLQRTLFR